MHPGRRHVDPAVRTRSWRLRLVHEQGIAWPGRVVHEAAAVTGPIELGGVTQIGRSAPPPVGTATMFTSPGCEPSRCRVQIETSEESGRESQRADRGVEELAHRAMSEIEIGAGADFAHQDVSLAVTVATNATVLPSREIAAACSVPPKSANLVNLALASGLRQK